MPDALCIGKGDLMESQSICDRREARALCLRCPLQQACLERAMALRAEHEEVWGTWGGMLFHGRRKPTIVRERVAVDPNNDWPKVPKDGQIRKHGRTGYRQGCKCKVCRDWQAAFSAHRRHRSKGVEVKDNCNICQEKEGLMA